VQVVCKSRGEIVSLKHIGSAHSEAQLALLMVRAEEVRDAGQGRLGLFGAEAEPGRLCVERSYSGMLWDALTGAWDALGFGGVGDEVFMQLVLARLIEPTSKLDSVRVLEGLGLAAPSNTAIHRCLGRIVAEGYRGVVSGRCFSRARPEALTLVLYDVTTLHFETPREDGYRKPGFSKERRLDPQICVGLLVDREGFPLEVGSFEGNKAEVKTMVPVLEGFKARHGLAGVSVAADAAMLSSANLAALEGLGYGYIVGSRVSKCPYEIEEHMKLPGGRLMDGQAFESSITATIGGKRVKRRAVYQWSEKRAGLDLRNIYKLLEKARCMVSGKLKAKGNRFVKTTGGRKSINEALVESARMRAGVKGYVTNLDIPAKEVIAHYHQLFEVEKSFRMAKSDLKARPIFHHKRESIEALLTIVLAALAVARHVEAATKMSIRRFVQTLLPLRSATISVNGAMVTLPPSAPQHISNLLAKLKNISGH
jgi:hypothetical protein